MYDPYDLTVKSYIQIHHANLYLLSKNLKFFQFCFEQDQSLIDIKKEFDWAKNISMDIDIYTEVESLDLTECNHPGPNTHKLAAEYLFNKLKNRF